MKALSVRQPWAWLIVHGYKDVENRDWATKRRGDAETWGRGDGETRRRGVQDIDARSKE